MLVLLIVTFLGVQVTCVVIVAIQGRHISGGKLWSYINDLSTSNSRHKYQRKSSSPAPINAVMTSRLLAQMTWILVIAWEILAMCLAAWTAVKHVRELQQQHGQPDCFAVLMRTRTITWSHFSHAFTSRKIPHHYHDRRSCISHGDNWNKSLMEIIETNLSWR